MRVLCTMLSGVPAAPGAPVIPAANISPLFNSIQPESGAAGHWVFGSNNFGMIDLVSGQEAQQGWIFTVTDGGSGYTSVPTVTITGGGGTGMTAFARRGLTTNTVDQIIIGNPGTGYTSAPAVTISGGGGTGATATIARANAPTMHENYLQTNGYSGHGVLLPLLDEAVQTLCVVARTPPDSVNAAFIGSLSSNFTGGDLIYKPMAEHRVNTRDVGDVIMTNAAGVEPGSTWTFLALSQSADTRIWMMGGAAARSGTAQKTASSGRAIGLGSVYLTGYATAVDIAEAIVFRSAKIETELNELYARRKAQLANAGITVL